ncbi:MAG: hypothetical protein JXR73_16070 [Candidatus Omnitrophica bacterium]|nr:hypothetical protein [Candidatus Omnitrophota bacterium]
MEEILQFTQGPLFRLAFALLVAGLFRRFVLILWPAVIAWRRSRDRSLNRKAIVRDIAIWLFPIHQAWRSQDVFTVISYVFHIGLVLVPLFLAEHVSLWAASTGITLPALPNGIADVLTILTIAGVSILLVVRLTSRLVRTFTRTEDIVVLVMILLPFLTGYAASASWNPFSYNLMLLLHILSAEALMIAIPFTKLSHCIFFPFSRVCAELGSKLVTDCDYTYTSPLAKGTES